MTKPNPYILGIPSVASATRKQLMNKFPPLEVGDMVAAFRFYKNGKPIMPHKYDYLADSIGIVVEEFEHELYHDTAIKVRWTKSNKVTTYMKITSGSYLVKLS